MICLLWLTDGRWLEKELPDEFLMQADHALNKCDRKGRVVISVLDEATETEIEYDCKDILMEYEFFNSEFLRKKS